MMDPNEMNAAGSRRGRSIFVIPTLFTSANIFCGFYAAIAALKGYHALGSDLSEAARYFNNAGMAIGWAVLFDSLDGTIARMTNATSEFGIELDSLADVLSFGIAPAILVYTWGCGMVQPSMGVEPDELGWAVSFMFLVCGAYRLARFNVQAHRAIPSSKKEKRHFVGMPIPAAAALIAAIVHFAPRPISEVPAGTIGLFGSLLTIEPGFWSLALLTLVVTLSLLMVSTVRYISFKDLAFSAVSPRRMVIYLSLLVCGIYFYSRWVLLLIASSYALHGVLTKLAQYLGGHPNRGSPVPEPAPKASS